MANVTVKTRIVNKHDTTANWNARSSFIPKAGEIIIYTDTHKVKVGDGTSTISALPFIDNVDLSNYVTESELASTIGETVTSISKTIDLVEDEITTHTSNTSNPHNVTKSQIGLGSVVNAGQTATPTSGSTSYFTAGGAYTLKQSIDGKANKNDVVLKNSNLGGGSASSTAPFIKGGQIDVHPENQGTVITYYTNDLAFLTQRGGTVQAKNTTLNKTITVGSAAFDGSPTYWSLNGNLNATTDTIEIIIKLPGTNVYAYSTNFGIGFGSATWRAKDVKIEAGYSAKNTGTASSPDTDIKWKTITNITNSESAVINIASNGPGTGQGGISSNAWSYLRYTLKNWNNINPRIAQIWTINYGSSGMHNTFVSRGGSTMYGTLTAPNVIVSSVKNASVLGTDSTGKLVAKSLSSLVPLTYEDLGTI